MLDWLGERSTGREGSRREGVCQELIREGSAAPFHHQPQGLLDALRPKQAILGGEANCLDLQGRQVPHLALIYDAQINGELAGRHIEGHDMVSFAQKALTFLEWNANAVQDVRQRPLAWAGIGKPVGPEMRVPALAFLEAVGPDVGTHFPSGGEVAGARTRRLRTSTHSESSIHRL